MFDRRFFGKHGYDVYCHDCRRALDEIENALQEKRCRQCGRTKPISEFGKNASTRDGYFKECVDCQDENFHRRRERRQKTSWHGEMGVCSLCGMLQPTYELTVPRPQRNTRYCRRCINKMVRERVQTYEEKRERHGWAVTKRCKDCGQVYPSDRFHLDRRKKDGFADFCDTCARQRTRARAVLLKERHQRTTLPLQTQKECSICHVVKPLRQFSKNEATVDGRSAMCIACTHKVREENARVWETLRLEKAATPKQLTCQDCGRVLPIDYFTRTRERKKGHLYYCKDCARKKEQRIFQRWEQQRKNASFEFSLDTPTEKACRACGRVLPLSEFWGRQASKDGHSHYCKDCQTKKSKERKKRLRQRGFPAELIPAQNKCNHCERVLPQVMFYRDSTTRTGLDRWCIDCRKAYDKEYRSRPEIRQRHREYCRRPEVLERQRNRKKVYQRKPEVQARIRVYKRDYQKRPYVREKRRIYDRLRYQRPEVKQKKKERDSRPEAKARRRKSTHAWYMRKKAQQEKERNQEKP